MYKTREDIMKRLEEHYSYVQGLFDGGNEIFGIFLQGSQNYGLDTEESDIDTKCIILPTLDTIVYNSKPISTTVKYNEIEQIDIKDIRLFFQNVTKMNLQYIELLFTPYFIVNPKFKDIWEELQNKREEIVRYNETAFISNCRGNAKSRFDQLYHPYPTKEKILEEYGYDPKQLHHLARIYYLMFDYAYSNKDYDEILYPDNDTRDILINIKNGCIKTKEKAIDHANMYLLAVDTLYELWIKNNKDYFANDEIKEFLNTILYKTIKRYLSEEIKNAE